VQRLVCFRRDAEEGKNFAFPPSATCKTNWEKEKHCRYIGSNAAPPIRRFDLHSADHYVCIHNFADLLLGHRFELSLKGQAIADELENPWVFGWFSEATEKR